MIIVLHNNCIQNFQYHLSLAQRQPLSIAVMIIVSWLAGSFMIGMQDLWSRVWCRVETGSGQPSHTGILCSRIRPGL